MVTPSSYQPVAVEVLAAPSAKICASVNTHDVLADPRHNNCQQHTVVMNEVSIYDSDND